MHITRLEPSPCPYCSYVCDSASSLNEGNEKPKPGDYTVCLKCTHFLTFDTDLNLSKMSDKEVKDILEKNLTELKKIRKNIQTLFE